MPRPGSSSWDIGRGIYRIVDAPLPLFSVQQQGMNMPVGLTLCCVGMADRRAPFD